MRIIIVCSNTIESQKAISYGSYKGNIKPHFNIRHGSIKNNGWQVSFGVSDTMVITELKNNSCITLDKDNYILVPIRRKDTLDFIYDNNKNKKYFIAENKYVKDNNTLAFIDIPLNYTNVTFEYVNLDIICVGKRYNSDTDEVIDLPVVMMNNSEVVINYTIDNVKFRDTINDKSSRILREEV